MGGMEFHVHIHVYCTYRMFSIDICCTLNSSKLTMGVHLLICQSTPPLPTPSPHRHMCNTCTCMYYYMCIHEHVRVCMHVRVIVY